MEIAVVILILILLIAGGMAALIVLGGDARVGALWSGRRLPRPASTLRSARVIDVPAENTKPVAARMELAQREETNTRLDELTAEIRATLASGDDRLSHLDQQLDLLRRGLHDRLEQIGREGSDRWQDLAARQASIESSQQVASERLRADLARELAERERRATASRYDAERAEITAELYALLARLEAAVAAVTNPVLLPGEPYVPPAELVPESLVWDNWKEVGERTFAFADLYSARRLYLNEATRDEIGAFVAELRGLLTQSIYPNLRQPQGPAERAELRAALETLADRFPAVRVSLEHDFRAIVVTTAPRRLADGSDGER